MHLTPAANKAPSIPPALFLFVKAFREQLRTPTFGRQLSPSVGLDVGRLVGRAPNFAVAGGHRQGEKGHYHTNTKQTEQSTHGQEYNFEIRIKSSRSKVRLNSQVGKSPKTLEKYGIPVFF